MKLFALGSAALVLSASTSLAALVYDNPYFAGSSGNEVTRWVQSSTFSLTDTTQITGGSVAVAGLGDISAWDGAFQYWIFDDNGGNPGSIAASGNGTNLSSSDTGVAWGAGGNIHEIDFTLDSTFTANAGSTYWFGVHLSTDFDRDEIYWVQSTTRNSTSESDGGTFNNWNTYTPARAFTLEGDALPPVPLPAGGLLLVSAVGGLVMVRRRKG